MADEIEILQNEIEDLKKQIWNLNRNIIPEIESKISGLTDDTNENLDGNTDENLDGEDSNTSSDTSNTSSASDEWIEIYNMESEDASINLDLTTGILGAVGRISAMPDLQPYSAIRIGYILDDQRSYHIFDITDKQDNFLHLISYNSNITMFLHMQIFFGVRDNKAILEFQNLTALTLAPKSYPSFTYKNKTAKYGVFRIQVK